MPTIDQLIEQLKKKREKFGGSAHCNQLFVSEEIRKEQIENAPDEKGHRKTRIGLETYSWKAYSAWNEMLEMLMQRCGCNPIIVVDLFLLMVGQADIPMDVCRCGHEQDSHTFDNFTNGNHGRCQQCECRRWTELDGIDIALEGLFKVMDYEKELRDMKEERRLRKLGVNPEEPPANSLVPKANLKGER